MKKQVKRWLVDAVGNYGFFVPIVVLLTPALHSWAGIQSYALAAVPLSLLGPRSYTLFLKYVWYPLWRVEEF